MKDRMMKFRIACGLKNDANNGNSRTREVSHKLLEVLHHGKTYVMQRSSVNTHTHTHTDRQTDRQRQTETDRQGDRQTETDRQRQGDRETGRQRQGDRETGRQRDRERARGLPMRVCPASDGTK